MTRVAVVGPGAIGAAVAAGVSRTPAELLLCGRTPMERLTVEYEDGTPPAALGPVITDPGRVAPVDLVLLAVKAHQTEGAAPWLRALARPGAVVVALQNGVEQREAAGRLVPEATVVPAVVWFPAEAVAPGRVRVRGEPHVTLPAERAARDATALLRAAGVRVDVAEDFATAAWRKLAVNAVAGLMVLTGRRAGMFRRPDIAAVARDLAGECLAVARAEGADLPAAVADQIVADMAAYPEDLGSSILFDHEAARPLEWDARNGVIGRRGAAHGIPTPVSDVVTALLACASH